MGFTVPADGDAAELVCDGDGVVVEHAGRRHPPRRGVVGEDDELVLERPVLEEVDALLDVGADDAVPDRLDVHHGVRDVLKEERWNSDRVDTVKVTG